MEAAAGVEEVAADRTQVDHRPAAGILGTQDTAELVRWVEHHQVGRVWVVVRVVVRWLASVASGVGIVASSTGSIAVGNTGCTCTACTAAVEASLIAGSSVEVLDRSS